MNKLQYTEIRELADAICSTENSPFGPVNEHSWRQGFFAFAELLNQLHEQHIDRVIDEYRQMCRA
jgi:hypothetical protein